MLSWLRAAVSRIQGSVHRPKVERELTEELQTHAEMLTEENIQRGMSAEEAQRQAALTLGNRSHIHEDYR
ncbi:MAG TPA: permease prefix domain 1-containing protein, partial [Candidatus Angelobacter sp.]|nr:permease prefix domain 1-containing protein [Candidatus Angelobacter sp.]